MSVIIENPQTGETRQLERDADGRYPNLMLPWRVKQALPDPERQAKRTAAVQKLTSFAASFGLPAHIFQQAGGLLLGCAKCTATAEITALLEAGKISPAEHKDLFVRVANAIDQRDEQALKELKGKLEALRKSR